MASARCAPASHAASRSSCSLRTTDRTGTCIDRRRTPWDICPRLFVQEETASEIVAYASEASAAPVVARSPVTAMRRGFPSVVAESAVTRVGATTLLSARGRPFMVDEQPPVSPDRAPTAVYRVATPDYFATMAIPLLRGRDFSSADRQDAPAVAIVNQTLARTFWANEDAIGRRIRLLGPPEGVSLSVIGVAGDVKEALDPRSPLRLDPRRAAHLHPRPGAQPVPTPGRRRPGASPGRL